MDVERREINVFSRGCTLKCTVWCSHSSNVCMFLCKSMSECVFIKGIV